MCIKIAFSTTFRPLKWRHQVAILNLCFIEPRLDFLLYHMQKTFFAYLYPTKTCKIFELPYKKRPMCGFSENRVLTFYHLNIATKWPKMKYLSHTILSSILSLHDVKIRFWISITVFPTKVETDVTT